MMSRPGVLKKAYDSVALVALLNVLGLAALVAVLINSGALTREKVASVLRIVRGEAVAVEQPEATTEGAAGAAKTSGKAAAADDVSQDDVEVLRLESERIKTELDQRLALNNSIMLRVMTEREAFRKEQEAAAKRQAVTASKRDEAGFKRQIAIYDGLPPKLAVQHLLDMNDPDQAARILAELKTSQAKKIVQSAKRGDQVKKMEDILQRVRDVAPLQAGKITSEGN